MIRISLSILVLLFFTACSGRHETIIPNKDYVPKALIDNTYYIYVAANHTAYQSKVEAFQIHIPNAP